LKREGCPASCPQHSGIVVLVGSQEANREAVWVAEVARAGATMGAPVEALRAASRYYPQKSADPYQKNMRKYLIVYVNTRKNTYVQQPTV
jgi:hypothetical protein